MPFSAMYFSMSDLDNVLNVCHGLPGHLCATAKPSGLFSIAVSNVSIDGDLMCFVLAMITHMFF